MSYQSLTILHDPAFPATVSLVHPMPDLLKRLEPPERIIFERPEPGSESPDPDLNSEYSGTLGPAWFALREPAALLALPSGTGVTGAAIAARLRGVGLDWQPFLRGLPVPTLVIHEEADLLPISVAEETVGTVEGARPPAVPDVGHTLDREASHRFLAAADAFLSHDDPETRR